MLSHDDLKSLEKRQISAEQVEKQLSQFRSGFPYLRLVGAATPGHGIVQLSDQQKELALARWHQFLLDGGEAMKMVPASGAASRMFKAMFNFIDGPDMKAVPGSDAANVIDNLEKFAFFDELNDSLTRLYGKDAKALRAEGEHKKIISAIVNSEGLDYGNLPKGLLSFHSYVDGPHTPIEEQLSEAAATETRADGTVHVHFTVSPEHRAKFEKRLADATQRLGEKYGVTFVTSISEQKKSTDTIAVNPDNTPFRVDGELVFRPGGHGALIENLNDLDADVVFLKNIDNVVPDSHRDATVKYKKVLGGYLILIHDRVAQYLDELENGKPTHDQLVEMVSFLRDNFAIDNDKIPEMSDQQLAEFIHAKLNRPMRVCGMVKNEGEPGGGPYIAYDADGSTSPQILESSQIDLSVDANKKMMAEATHFNPVDLVCYIHDAKGRKFDLRQHVDPATGFISEKSLHGRVLRALELPGLWNGAMSDWLTIFVEVPIATFNPVKTINDLLRPMHL